MAKPLTAQKIFRSIYTVIERRMGMVPDELAPSVRISQWFDGDPGTRQEFIHDLEARIGIDIDDEAVVQCETFQDLCDWCARRSAALAENHHHSDDDDDDDYLRAYHRSQSLKKFFIPLFMGLLVAVMAVAVVWWRKGCPKFW